MVINGGIKLTRTNAELLQRWYDVEEYSTLADTVNIFDRVSRAGLVLRRYLGGFNMTHRARIEKALVGGSFDVVFVDHSQLGICCEIVRAVSPSVKIVTHFHNVEYDYFAQTRRRGLGTYLLRHAAFRNEYAAAKLSDVIITLTERDSCRLGELYGRTDAVPIPAAVPVEVTRYATPSELSEGDLLFVGAKFHPNVEALKWLVKHVLPHISRNLVAVGFQLELLREQIKHERLRIIGTVDSVAPYYNRAAAVVCPIFSGAGMNTKAVEALAYDRMLITNGFGLRGFPRPLPSSVIECEAPGDIIAAIDRIGRERVGRDSRQYYEAHLSPDARANKVAAAFVHAGIDLGD